MHYLIGISSGLRFWKQKWKFLLKTKEKLYDFMEGVDAEKEALMKFESIKRKHSDTLRKVKERIL